MRVYGVSCPRSSGTGLATTGREITWMRLVVRLEGRLIDGRRELSSVCGRRRSLRLEGDVFWVCGIVVAESVAEVVWRLHHAEWIFGKLILRSRRASGRRNRREIPTVERIMVVRVHIMEVHIEVLEL